MRNLSFDTEISLKRHDSGSSIGFTVHGASGGGGRRSRSSDDNVKSPEDGHRKRERRAALKQINVD